MKTVVGNHQKQVTVTKEIRETVRRTARETARQLSIPEETEVSITFMDDEGIRGLNREYRKLDCPTDVLSFALNEQQEAAEGLPFANASGVHLLGEIVISLERARSQAQEYGHSLEREIGYLTVHGMLHLLGFDHNNREENDSKMREWEEKILAALNLTR